MKAYLILVLFASVSLTTSASAHDAILHDAAAGFHDMETVHHDEQRVSDDARSLERDAHKVDDVVHDADEADRETGAFVHDAMRADGLLHEDDKESERKRVEDERAKEREAEQLECDRLELLYYLRHPPGTKPSGLRGLHGCALYRADARWHDKHPDVISVLGDNIGLIP